MQKTSICALATFFAFFSLETFAQTFGGESVEYDPSGNRFFTSSDATSIVQRKSDGTISYFGSGLQASYGMEVFGNHLFAIEGQVVYGYDLTTEALVMTASIAGSTFLNGLAHDGVNTLYASDFSAKKIYKIDVADLSNPVITTLVSSTVSTPNGLLFDIPNQRLIMVSWGTNAAIKAIDPTSGALTTLVTTTLGNIDGIDNDSNGNFFVSSWNPARITKYDPTFTTPTTITVAGINSPADICYAKEIDTLAIPNGNNTVSFVGFGSTTGLQSASSPLSISIYPNPTNTFTSIEFELQNATEVSLTVYSANGAQVMTLLEGLQPNGLNKIIIPSNTLPAGRYICTLNIGKKILSKAFTVQ